MPSLSDNKAVWNDRYDWSEQGDEWSEAWGGPSYQWWTTLFPRLQGFVPADAILEIAPGYGRWTHYLKDLCHEIVIVDIAETAIAHCRRRFADYPHVSAHVNDGTSLEMVRDRSIDLVFSFDTLVHAELDVMAAYLQQISEKLTGDGVAFLHHSNMGSYEPGSYDPHNIHWRATSVSAAEIEGAANHFGLVCVSQEQIAWGNNTLLNDCISVIARPLSPWDRGNVVVENMTFTDQEIAMAHRLSRCYPPSSRGVAFTATRR